MKKLPSGKNAASKRARDLDNRMEAAAAARLQEKVLRKVKDQEKYKDKK